MFYRTLNVTRKATNEEIKISYRRLALATHPDKCGGSQEKFLEIQKAYEVLSDPVKREEYDGFMAKKRSKLRGFVRPEPFKQVSKAVTYKLADEKSYTFETSSDKVRCGLRYGDVIMFNDVAGCFIGLAADDHLYWCPSGQSHASRLCHCESSFAMSSIRVIQRANLDGGRIHVAKSPTRRAPRGAAGEAPQQRASEHKSTAQRMFEELRRKEGQKLADKRIRDCMSDEQEEREYYEVSTQNSMDEIYSNISIALHAFTEGLPLDSVTLRWLGYSAPPPISSSPLRPNSQDRDTSVASAHQSVTCNSSELCRTMHSLPSTHCGGLGTTPERRSEPQQEESPIKHQERTQPTVSPSPHRASPLSFDDDDSECSFTVHVVVDDLSHDAGVLPTANVASLPTQDAAPLDEETHCTVNADEQAGPSAAAPVQADDTQEANHADPVPPTTTATGRADQVKKVVPRYMDSTRAARQRTNKGAAAAATNSSISTNTGPTLRKKYDDFSVDELWAQEEAFMKEFAAKQRKGHNGKRMQK